MRTIIAVFLVFSVNACFAQAPNRDSLKVKYLHAIQKLNSIYKCSNTVDSNVYIQPDALDSSFLSVFSTVILNDENLIKNGSAGSVTQDKDKATLSFNYSTIDDSLENVWNFGVFANTSGSVFQFYSKNAWQNGTGLNIGYTKLSGPNRRSYDSVSCTELVAARKRFLTQLTAKYSAVIDMNIDSLKSRKKEMEDSLNFDSLQENMLRNLSVKPYQDLLDRYKHLSDTIDVYNKLVTHPSFIDSIEYEKNALNDIVDFDKKNSKLTGYFVTWFSHSLNFGINSQKMYNDTLKTSDSLLHFYKKDYLRAKYTFSVNQSSFQPRHLYYWTLSASLYNTNFLENKSISDIPYIQYDSTFKKIGVKNNDGKTLGSLDELKKNVIALNPALYGAWFFGEAKIVGIELNGSYQIYLNKAKDVTMPNAFTATLGFLLRVNNTDALSKATIGINAGLINAEEKSKVWHDSFAAQIKVGVPFQALFK